MLFIPHASLCRTRHGKHGPTHMKLCLCLTSFFETTWVPQVLQHNSLIIHCNYDTASEPKLLGLLSLNMIDWSTFQRWVAKVEVAGLPHEIEQHHPASADMLKRILAAEAVPNSGNMLVLTPNDEEQQSLSHLQDCGMVTCHVAHDNGLSQWCLSSEGMQRLETRLILSSPQDALLVRDVPRPEMMTWELLKSLIDAGWELHIRNRGRGAGPKPPAYRLGADKIWWIRCGEQSVCREYLLALLLASEGPSEQMATREVPHFGKTTFYMELVEQWVGSTTAKRRRRGQRQRQSIFQFHASDSLTAHNLPPPRARSRNTPQSQRPQQAPSAPAESPAPENVLMSDPIDAGRVSMGPAEELHLPLPNAEARSSVADLLPPEVSGPSAPTTFCPLESSPIGLDPVPEARPIASHTLADEPSSHRQLQPSIPSRRDIRRQRQSGSFGWGQFWFGHRPGAAGKAGTYEVTCKIHSEGGKRCTKSKVFHNEQETQRE